MYSRYTLRLRQICDVSPYRGNFGPYIWLHRIDFCFLQDIS